MPVLQNLMKESGGYWVLHRDILEVIKSKNAALLLMEYCHLYNYFEEVNGEGGEFYRSRRVLGETLFMTGAEVEGAEQILVDLKLVSIVTKGVPCCNYYILDIDRINSLVVDRKTVSVSGSNETEFNRGLKLYSNLKSNTVNKLTDSDFDKPKTDEPKLIKKEFVEKAEEKPILQKRVIRPSFVDVNGKYKETKKNNDSIEIQSTIKTALAYWNSKEELVTHIINEENPSKTLLHCIQLIKMFFSGKLVKHSLLPKSFDHSLWKGGRQTLEDWKYFVDEICLCLNDPGLLPKKNGKALALPIFLEGSERLELPAFIFNYCLGEYKTATVDINPNNTVKIKAFWEQLIGKFKDTPENQKAFVAISNLSEQTFAERRKTNKNWIPAMNEYFPANIVKSILRNNLWIKEKGHQPAYMDTKFFKQMVSRYDYDRTTGKIVF